MLLELIYRTHRVFKVITAAEWYPDGKVKIIRPDGLESFLSPKINEEIIIWDGPREVCRIMGQTYAALTNDDWYALYQKTFNKPATYKKTGEWIEYKEFKDWKANEMAKS